jgi:hypothetical protein
VILVIFAGVAILLTTTAPSAINLLASVMVDASAIILYVENALIAHKVDHMFLIQPRQWFALATQTAICGHATPTKVLLSHTPKESENVDKLQK